MNYLNREITIILTCKFLLLILLSSVIGGVIPYKGAFSYKEVIASYSMPKAIYSFANFDGAHYIKIAKEGYHNYDQAFFPLYPLLIRYIGNILHNNYLIAGLFISYCASLFGFSFIYHALKKMFDKKTALRTVFAIIAFPTGFFFHMVYTEGIYIFLIGFILLYVTHNKHGSIQLVLAGFLTGLTKIMGVFTLLLLLIREKSTICFTRNDVMLLLMPIIGLGTYMIYLQNTTGDPLFFLTSQPAFGANRSTNIILLPQVYYRYIHIFFSADQNFQYWVAVFEFFVFNLIGLLAVLFTANSWYNRNRTYFILGLFSILHLLIPTMTGTLSSLPRYALFSLVSFILISQLGDVVYKKYLVGSMVLQVVVFSFFIQGYFVS